MNASSRYQEVDNRNMAQRCHAKGWSIIPLDPVLNTPTEDPAYWPDHRSATTIDRHWEERPDDALGYLVDASHLVVVAMTGDGSERLHALADTCGVASPLITRGTGGETWHLACTPVQHARAYPESKHIKVLKVGDVARLHFVADTKEIGSPPAPVSEQFQDTLFELMAESASPPAASAPETVPPVLPMSARNPMARFSLKGHSATLAESVQAQSFALGSYALMGQATAIYAAPNTGKTLLVLHGIAAGIRAGLLNPENVYFFNLDDNGEGLLTKLRIAEQHGFHMIVDGHQGFTSQQFLDEIRKLIDTEHPKGMVVILDTVKKVADLMDKRGMAEFTAAIRRFVLKGGTVIALAHTNKKVGLNGRPIYAGTSDMVDDFDCAYVMQALPAQTGKLVELRNIKRRGPAAEVLAFSYASTDDYTTLLNSVRELSSEERAAAEQHAQMALDADLIDAIKAAIEGKKTKRMELAAAARKEAFVSRAEILRVIDLYAGDDPKRHFWKFSIEDRGAKVYRLLDAASLY